MRLLAQGAYRQSRGSSKQSKNTESQSVETELQFSDVVKMENFDPDAAITSWWMTFIAPVSEDYTIH